MTWQKGQTGNPGGRPEKVFADEIRKATSIEDKVKKVRKLRLIAEKVVAEAIKGEAWAVQMVADRLDGKPHQTSETTVKRVSARELSDDELANIAAGGGEGDAVSPPDSSQLN